MCNVTGGPVTLRYLAGRYFSGISIIFTHNFAFQYTRGKKTPLNINEFQAFKCTKDNRAVAAVCRAAFLFLLLLMGSKSPVRQHVCVIQRLLPGACALRPV